MKLVFAITTATIFLTLAASARAQGNCSPKIERTGGDVSVSCGPSDVDIAFLLNTVGYECRSFSIELEQWVSTAVRNGIYNFARMPQFSPELINDISVEKAVISQYDPSFSGIYTMVAGLPRTFQSIDYYFDRNDMIQYEELDYLEGVSVLCTWAGTAISLERHREYFDLRGYEKSDPADRQTEELFDQLMRLERN